MLERYTTERIPPRQRIRRWCEYGSNTLSSLNVHPYDPEVFSAKLLRAVIGELGVTVIETTPAHAVGTGALGSWAGGCQGAVLIALQKSGKSRLLQAGRDVELTPGDVVMWDLQKHWEIDARQNSLHICIKVPSNRLRMCLGELEPHLAVPLRASDRRTDLLVSVMESIERLAFNSAVETPVDAVSEVLLGAARVAYSGHLDGSDACTNADRFRGEVLRFVDARIHDPSVSVASLAASLGMSIRSFQRVFFQSGMSPRDYIRSRRIDMAAEKLRELSGRIGGRITEVAIASGFNDPGYFSRAFQQRFGVTPSEYLRRHRSTISDDS